jgi:NitT/TauT family transport system ATP-binding protein
MAAGLLSPNAGHVIYKGVPLKGANTNAGYLTQENALLPWRDVVSNIALPLEIKGFAKSERLDRARDMLQLVGLKGFERHLPRQLSGGMRKRVSLARTLIYKPETLLLDEPFSALDAQTRIIIQEQLLSICSALSLTVLLVTHDIAEAVGMANRVVLFSRRPATVSDIVEVGHSDVRHLTHTDAAHQVHVERIWSHLRAQSMDVSR